MEHHVFKRCPCTRPVLDHTGVPIRVRGRIQRVRLEGGCPRLAEPGHGSWWYQLELPRGTGRSRCRLRRGGLADEQQARTAVATVRELLAVPALGDARGMNEVTALIRQTTRTGEALPDPETVRRRYRHHLPLDGGLTVGAWLDRWLDGRRNLRLSTRTGYACHIRLYLKPHLGHLRLDQLHSDDVHAMFEAIDVHNDAIHAARASDDATVRASVRYRKPASAATKRRICSLLRGALNTALDRRYVDHNAAAHIELDPAAPPKALLWTDERIARWRRINHTPSPVMVWTPELTGAFLDHAAADPYYPLFHLLAHLGLRRGEAAGLRWSDLDERTRHLSIERQLVVVDGRLHLWAPKTLAARRHIPLDPATLALLRSLPRHNDDNPPDDWGDLIFRNPNGGPLDPGALTSRFRNLINEADLPPIRLHGLRHSAATTMLGTGAHLKVIQEILGHSRYTTTAELYTTAPKGQARAALQAAATLISGS